MFSLASKILIFQDHDSQNTACFGKKSTEFPRFKCYSRKDTPFLLKGKKNYTVPKTLNGRSLNTKDKWHI